MTSHLQRTKERIIKSGSYCAIVERFVENPMTPHGLRSDMFEMFDLVSMKPYDLVIGVQCCGADFQAHYRKITIAKVKKAHCWLSCNCRIQIWSWRKLLVKRGGKAVRWTPKIVEITMEDIKYNDNRSAYTSAHHRP